MIRRWLTIFSALAPLFCVLVVWLGDSRGPSPLKLVGSETVYPYAAAVGETIACRLHCPVPVLESVGTGAGIQLFARGNGPQTPSILMASRKMTLGDYALCQRHGIPKKDILEIKIGYDGLVLTQAPQSPPLELTFKILFAALSAGIAPLPVRWSSLSKTLPHTPIKILGPASVSGTYESLLAKILDPFCGKNNRICKALRTDGAYQEMGLNQNLIVQKILKRPGSIGIVTFSFFKENQHLLTAIPLEGVIPTFETLSTGAYPLSRPLYLYVKRSHLLYHPEIRDFSLAFFEGGMAAPTHYLIAKGLIPLPKPARDKAYRHWAPLLEVPHAL